VPQNQLTEEHIAKIIGTYQFRKEEDPATQSVGMERIAEGKATTSNISRCVALPGRSRHRFDSPGDEVGQSRGGSGDVNRETQRVSEGSLDFSLLGSDR